MSEITVNGWVRQFIFQLFINRGYSPDDEAVQPLLDSQWDHWKRLMVKSGLNADQLLAEEIAFEFNCKAFKGGAGRIFEHFAEFIAGRPKPVREKEYVQHITGIFCQDCEDRGYVGVPMVSVKTGISTEKIHRCHCLNGVKYAAFPMATPQILDDVARYREQESKRLNQWLIDRGIPVGPDAEFRKGFRRWVDAQGGLTGIFKPVCQALKSKPAAVNEEEVLANW